MELIIQNLKKSYKNGVTVFDGFNIQFEHNSITAIMGVSGSGKTTLLNCVAGILPYEGSISAQGDISYIFQKERLIPNLTAAKNIEFVLAGKYPDRAERASVAREYLAHVKLSKWADKYPRSLSGGMQQRVSMARAFAYPSHILLMDEPFKSLDIGLKLQMLSLLDELLQKKPKTTVFVTHDIDEALLVADRVVILGGAPADIIFDVAIKGARKDRIEQLNSGGFKDIKQQMLTLLYGQNSDTSM